MIIRLVIGPNTTVLPGDTIITSDGSSVVIEFVDDATGAVIGHGKIENGKVVRFDPISISSINPLLEGSTADEPVLIGTESNINFLSLLNERIPSAGTSSAEESSRTQDSQTVVQQNLITFTDRLNEQTLADGEPIAPPDTPRPNPNPIDPPDVEPLAPIDDPTTIGGDTTGAGDEDDEPITGRIIAVDNNGLSNNNAFGITGNPENGSANINSTNGEWSYTPATNFNGNDAFNVTITDDLGNTTIQTITLIINPVNDPSTTTGDTSGTIDEDDRTITGTLIASDVDGLNNNNIFSITGNPTNGNASIDPSSGAWTYTPATNFNGNDTFTVAIVDDLGNTTTQTITLTINPVNDPTMVTGTFTGAVNEGNIDDAAVTATGALNISDVDADDNPSFADQDATLGDNRYGSFVLASGVWTYTVDTTTSNNQVLFESGGSGTGLVIFQQGDTLRVSIGNDNNVDLTTDAVLTNGTRYGIVVDLAAGNQLSVYLGELDGSGVPVGNITQIANITWSGSSDWSGSDGGGWGTRSGSQQAQAEVTYSDFSGTWHTGRFYSGENVPLQALSYTENDGPIVINNDFTIEDVDASATITSATISITSGFVNGEDVLAFIDTANITGSYNATTGVLTLTGSDTLANYEAAFFRCMLFCVCP